MKRFPRPLILLAVALAALLALEACVPQRVVWSPDGSRAAVIGSDGLHFCDATGKLGPAILPGQVQRVAWLPDGKRVVVVRAASFPTWNDVVKLEPGLEQAIAPQAKAGRAKFVASGGDVASFSDGGPFASRLARLAAMYLRDTDGPALRKELGENWAKIAELSYDVPLCEAYDITNDEVGKPRLLMIGQPEWSIEVRPSPGGQAVAITMWNSDSEMSIVDVAPTDFGPDHDDVILGEGCAYPDWTPDGKSLLFVKAPGRPWNGQEGKGRGGLLASVAGGRGKSEEVRFGTLVRQTVIGADGKLIEEHAKLPPEEGLAGMVYEPMGRVRVAKDGRIFFTSRDVQLPATAADLPTTQTLFFIQPGKQATVSRAAPRSVEAALGNQLQLFELSPDGAFVAVPSDHGQVSVLDLAKGDVQRVQAIEDRTSNDWTLQSVPAWRSATELTFVKPVKEGSAEREVVVHSMADGTERVLSGSWADAARDGWLTPPAP